MTPKNRRACVVFNNFNNKCLFKGILKFWSNNIRLILEINLKDRKSYSFQSVGNNSVF
jgi:hypothetical protein